MSAISGKRDSALANFFLLLIVIFIYNTYISPGCRGVNVLWILNLIVGFSHIKSEPQMIFFL